MKKFFNKQSGFTLVELLVVIAIIAVLGVVAIAAINPAARINSAKDQQALANVQSIGKAMEACLTDRMTGTPARTQAQATDDCCGAAVAGACTSTTAVGLGFYGYGFNSGTWPTGIAVTRGPAAGSAICISQLRGSDALYDKYLAGGGTVSITAAAACSAVSGT